MGFSLSGVRSVQVLDELEEKINDTLTCVGLIWSKENSTCLKTGYVICVCVCVCVCAVCLFYEVGSKLICGVIFIDIFVGTYITKFKEKT